MRITFAWLLLMFPAYRPMFAQCPVTVTAEANPPLVCSFGATTTLVGNAIGGNVIETLWEPANLVGNPSSAVTTGTVLGPTVFKFTAKVQTDNDLIVNGDFSSGNSGFSSQLNYVAPGPAMLTGGTYTIITSPTQISAAFPPCDDHTTGTGNMLAINCINTPNRDVWCQNVSVNPDSEYNFGMWVMTVFSLVTVDLIVTVNGVQIGNSFAPTSTFCQWSEFSAIWEANGATSAEICITNTNGAPFGPYFALDDISFIEICRKSVDVMADVVDIEAFVLPPTMLNCLISTVDLDGSQSSSGPFISYDWSTTNGNIVNGQQSAIATVDAPGDYTLSVNYLDGQGTDCTKSYTVRVFGDFQLPMAQISIPDTLNCIHSEIELDGIGSSVGNHIRYLWTTEDGNIVSGENSLFPLVNMPGTYLLTVSNENNFCLDTAMAFVQIDTVTPIADILLPDTITCVNKQIRLDGSGSSSGSNFRYQWQAINSRLLNPSDLEYLDVDTAGTYRLIVLDTLNGCASIDSVLVLEKVTLPIIQIEVPDTLTCSKTIVVIDASGSSSDSIYRFSWNTSDGHFATDTNTLTPAVDRTGTYSLSVLDTTNQCIARRQIRIYADTLAPIAEAGMSQTFFCSTDSLQLDGSGSSQGVSIQYHWDSPTGRILSGDTLLAPFVGSAGEYILTVLDTLNGCVASDTVQIISDANIPVIVASTPDTLTCSRSAVRLDVSGSDSTASIRFQWEVLRGSILRDSNSYQPLVNQAGEYLFTLENTANACRNSILLRVAENRQLPSIAIQTPDTISCNTPQVVVNANGSDSGIGFSIQWHTDDGSILDQSDPLHLLINAGGHYLFEITNIDNGCTDSLSIQVEENLQKPQAVIESPDTLTCTLPSFELNAGNSSYGPDYSIIWDTDNGNFIGSRDTLTPIVDAPGIYSLTITDLRNGCQAQDSVRLFENKILPDPTIQFEGSDTLNCQVREVFLISVAHPNYLYAWTNATSAANDNRQPRAQTTLPGLVIVIVTDESNGCTAADTVQVFEDAGIPAIDAGEQKELTCLIDSVQLDGSAPATGSGIFYTWATTDGFILSGANTLTPFVNQPGTYYLRVENRNNGCYSIDSVQVTGSADLPVAQAAARDSITCRTEQVTIDGTGSSIGVEYIYKWTTFEGNILTGASSLSPVVNRPGTYQLQVTNVINGCSTIMTVQVEADTLIPVAIPALPDTITCRNNQVNLSADLPMPASNYRFEWRTLTGNFISGMEDSVAIVDRSGNYELHLQFASNGCTSLIPFEVYENQIRPTAIATTNDQITCVNDTVRLSGSGSSTGSGFQHLWTTANGNLTGSSTSLQTTCNAPGDYFLNVTDLSNGCSSSPPGYVQVGIDTISPSINIERPDTLNCQRNTVFLNGNYSSVTNPLILWTTPDGNILSGDTSKTPLVNQPGLYILSVTNTDNGCESSVQVLVILDTIPPVVTIAPPAILTCAVRVIQLDASGSSTGSQYSYRWNTPDGLILSGGSTLRPTIEGPGTYRLTITNIFNGCVSTDSIFVIEKPNTLEGVELDLLQPDCIQPTGNAAILSVMGGTGPYEYSIDGGITFTYQFIFPNISPGSHTMTVRDDEGCLFTENFTIRSFTPVDVSAAPSIQLSIGEMQQIQVSLNVSPGSLTSVQWTPPAGLSCSDCLEPIITGTDSVTYQLVVRDSFRCVDSVTIRVAVEANFGVYIPNGFSPNDDGVNDFFTLFGKEGSILQIKLLQVYDRWGNKVFERQDFAPNIESLGWDGTYKNKRMNSAVFAWFAKVEFSNGVTEFFKGDLTLVR